MSDSLRHWGKKGVRVISNMEVNVGGGSVWEQKQGPRAVPQYGLLLSSPLPDCELLEIQLRAHLEPPLSDKSYSVICGPCGLQPPSQEVCQVEAICFVRLVQPLPCLPCWCGPDGKRSTGAKWQVPEHRSDIWHQIVFRSENKNPGMWGKRYTRVSLVGLQISTTTLESEWRVLRRLDKYTRWFPS